MNEIALANFYRVLNDADRFPKEHELSEAAIAAKDELNALRAHPSPQPEAATIDAAHIDDAINTFVKKYLPETANQRFKDGLRAALLTWLKPLLLQHASEHAGEQGADSRIPGLVNGIRSLILFHTKNGTMHGDCASDFAELVAPYPSYAPSGEVINEAAAPDSAREGEKS